jgi:hypothetical protein
VLIVLAALAVPAQALGGAQVRLQGSDAGHFALAQKTCGPKRSWHRVDIAGTGRVSALGNYSYAAVECFDGSLFYFGTFTMTTLNGDSLVGSYRGTVGSTAKPKVASYDQKAVVIGGTGRFAGASGTFRVSGLANLATGGYSQKLSGIVRQATEKKPLGEK